MDKAGAKGVTTVGGGAEYGVRGTPREMGAIMGGGGKFSCGG